MAERCPTCGSAVTVVSGDEGTSHYEPLRYGRAVKALSDDLHAAREAGNAMYAVLDRPDDYDREAVAAVMDAWLTVTLDRERRP